MTEPIQLVTGQTDQQRATEIKQALIESLKPTLDILTKAYSEGFIITYSCSPNSFKQVVIQQITVSKLFDQFSFARRA